MGARTVVKGAKTATKKILKEPKAIVKAAIKPAVKKETRSIAIGIAASPLVNAAYSYGFNLVISKIPFLMANPVIAQIIKIGAPLVPAYFVQQFRVPAGNIINGCLYGTSLVQTFNLIVGLAGGALAIPKGGSVDASQLSTGTNNGFFGNIIK